MVLGKKGGFFGRNGAEIRPLEMGRKGPVTSWQYVNGAAERPTKLLADVKVR